MRTKMLVAVAATITAVVGCEQATPPDTNIHSSAAMTGAKVKPTATTATATGTALASINTTTGVFGYSVTWNGLSGVVTGGAHIHGPADENNTGGTLVTFGTAMAGGASQTNSTAVAAASAGTSGALDTTHITATVTLDSLKKLFKAGMLYVDIHTVANPGGEIRAQLKP